MKGKICCRCGFEQRYFIGEASEEEKEEYRLKIEIARKNWQELQDLKTRFQNFEDKMMLFDKIQYDIKLLKEEIYKLKEQKAKQENEPDSILTETNLIPIETDRDGRFVAYDNGTVDDTKAGLMWANEDNEYDITFEDAEKYCKNYRGGGYSDWRIPSANELMLLFDSNNNYKLNRINALQNIQTIKLIHLSSACVWSSDFSQKLSDIFNMFIFNFNMGAKEFTNSANYNGIRVLPIRLNES